MMGTSEHDASADIDDETMVVLEGSPSELDMFRTNAICESSETTKPSKVVQDSPNIPSIFQCDVVRSNGNGMLGIVTKVSCGLGSDGDGDVESDADGNTQKYSVGGWMNPLLVGQIQVWWMDDSNTTQKLSDVTLVDRDLTIGCPVAATSDPTGQLGLVRDGHVTVDLVASDGYVLKGVSERDLVRVCKFTTGDFVVLGPWLGQVDELKYNVTVLFDNGGACRIMKVDPHHLKPIGKIIHDESRFPFYPGQRVKATTSHVLKNVNWISGSRKSNRVKGTITKFSVASVIIHWLDSAGYGPDSSTAPAVEQSPKNLKLLPYYSSHPYWELGDWCLLPSRQPVSVPLHRRRVSKNLEHNESLILKLYSAHASSNFSSQPTVVVPFNQGESMNLDNEVKVVENYVTSEDCPSTKSNSCDSSLSVLKKAANLKFFVHRKRVCKLGTMKDKKFRKKDKTFERAFFIFNTVRSATVDWQNGIIERDVKSTNLIPIHSAGYYEFCPGQYVVKKNSDDIDDACENKHVGVVSIVNAKEKTTTVRWLKAVNSGAEDPLEFDKEEVVSVYEIEEHSDHIYQYGDLVVRVPPSPDLAETDKNQCFKCKNETFMGFSDLSWVGNITDQRNGDVEVKWGDGVISKVRPQSIYVAARCRDRLSDEESVSDESEVWETGSQFDVIGNTMEVNSNVEAEGGAEVRVNVGGWNGLLSLGAAMLGFVASRLTCFLPGKYLDLVAIECARSGDVEYEVPESGGLSESQKSECIGDVGSETEEEEKEEVCCRLKHFDTATDPMDHYFVGRTPHNSNSNGRKWMKRIQRDWRILRNNIPDGIYVRVYEERMDLIRAAIVGAHGTPYHDGLFFFDFYLPPDYPDVPPLAYYHSGGWRINPNLYEDGGICLSLLNTWNGSGKEIWDPHSSTILQLLVSLQGLVLNSDPFFNEAGYEEQIGTAEGERKTFSYSENTFLLNCKTMMHVLRRPPKDFEGLIVQHFKRRGYYTMKACDAYMKGHSITSLTENATFDTAQNGSSSVGFRLMLAKIVPEMYLAFTRLGSDCADFTHLLTLHS